MSCRLCKYSWETEGFFFCFCKAKQGKNLKAGGHWHDWSNRTVVEHWDGWILVLGWQKKTLQPSSCTFCNICSYLVEFVMLMKYNLIVHLCIKFYSFVHLTIRSASFAGESHSVTRCQNQRECQRNRELHFSCRKDNEIQARLCKCWRSSATLVIMASASWR